MMITQRNRDYPTYVVHLPLDVTFDLFAQPSMGAYRFLHKSGEYLRESDGQSSGTPTTVRTWTEATRYAAQQDAAFIVNFGSKHVYFSRSTPSGAQSWHIAAPVPHPRLEEFNHAQSVPYEPLADGSQPKPKRKQLSGAQKRKLYGR